MRSSSNRHRASGKRLKLSGKEKRKRLIRRGLVLSVVLVLTGYGFYLWSTGQTPVGEAADDWYEVKAE